MLDRSTYVPVGHFANKACSMGGMTEVSFFYFFIYLFWPFRMVNFKNGTCNGSTIFVRIDFCAIQQ